MLAVYLNTYKLVPYILKSDSSVFSNRLGSDCLRARNETDFRNMNWPQRRGWRSRRRSWTMESSTAWPSAWSSPTTLTQPKMTQPIAQCTEPTGHGPEKSTPRKLQ